MQKNEALTELKSNMNVSPTKIYRFQRHSKPCPTSKCKEIIDFNWHLFDEPCMLHFMCRKLSGHICGDYGLKLTVDDEKVDICKTNVTTILPLEETGYLEYWYTQDDRHDMTCYLWCHTDKNFNAEVDQDFFNSALSEIVSISVKSILMAN